MLKLPAFIRQKTEEIKRMDYELYHDPLRKIMQNSTPEKRDRLDELDSKIKETIKLNWVDWGVPGIGIITTANKIKKAAPYVKEFSELAKLHRPLPREIYSATIVQCLEVVATGAAIVYGLSKLI